MILLILLAYFIIACFVTVCAEKIFEEEFKNDEDNVAQYLIGMFWIVSVPFIAFTFGLHYLGKFLCKNFRKLLNVNQC
jgi:hypothetical protein